MVGPTSLMPKKQHSGVAIGVALFALAVLAGHLLAHWAPLILGSRWLPWIVGRALGLAAFLALAGLVVTGIWFRHPWRTRWPGKPGVQLRAHAALGAATVVLVAVHVTSLALDRYAGVGWVGAFVPGRATYRPLGVAVGIGALYLVVVIVGTAALAGSVARHVWFHVHKLSTASFACAWAHGMLAGSDERALRWIYLGAGGMVAALLVTRAWSRRRNRSPTLVHSR